MTTKNMINSVFAIATSALLGGAARADVISIDFNRRDVSTPARTATDTVTDVNGDTSLPGQTGLWNELLVGEVGAGFNQPAATNQLTTGPLLDGTGAPVNVSLTFNADNDAYYAYEEPNMVVNLLHRDWVLVTTAQEPADWLLSGLEPSTVYRLRMFGRENGVEGSADTAQSPGTFTATGATSDSGTADKATQNYVDLWVRSTAGGEISGTLDHGAEPGAWSGMQIEWNFAPVISVDFGRGNPTYAGVPASGMVVDNFGNASLPGQAGAWNVLSMGTIDGGAGQTWQSFSTKEEIGALLDGEGNATTVSFAFNTGLGACTAYQGPIGPSTELHRDACYATTGPKQWRIDGLTASTEYTLRCFGLNDNAGGPRLFADFSATGLNTASGTTSLTTNYVDMVVTSTISGVITGTLDYAVTAGTWSGIQIQGPEPFLLASDLISIDIQTAASNQSVTASGIITDVNGHTSFGQAGVWNQLLAGVYEGNYNQLVNEQPSITGLTNSAGDATTVAFHFNTGTTPSYFYAFGLGDVSMPLHSDSFYTTTAQGNPAWQITGLEPYAYYTLRMFGIANADGPYLFSTFTASGVGTVSGSTSSATNYVDLTLASSVAGIITGELVNKAGDAGNGWSGMQILKLTDDPYVPSGAVILIQ